MNHSLFGKTTLAAAALAGFLMFSGVPRLAADDCQHRVARAEHRLDVAVEHHGYRSSQAQQRRHGTTPSAGVLLGPHA